LGASPRFDSLRVLAISEWNSQLIQEAFVTGAIEPIPIPSVQSCAL